VSETGTIHATTVSLDGFGVLLRGAPGSGKSALALQLIEQQGTGLGPAAFTALLVADDQTILTRRDDVLFASAPDALRGLLELRGLGLLPVNIAPDVAVRLVVDLQPSSGIDRLPAPESLRTTLLGVVLPRIAIDATHPSAAARVRTACVWVMKAAFPP
jgi:HPr kinase/phosphorylase